MKIVHCRTPKALCDVSIAQLTPGTVFRHPAGEDLYIRTDTHKAGMSSCELDAVNLRTGAMYTYPPSKTVIPVNAEIHHFGDRTPDSFC